MSHLEHLILQTGLKCHCGTRASQWTRCRKCKDIVARCGGHGTQIERETATHCQ